MWQLVSFEMDEGGKDIGGYIEEGLKLPIRRVSLEEIAKEAARYSSPENKLVEKWWPKPHIYGKEQLKVVMNSFVSSENPTFALYGTGWFHHFTYGLTAAAKQFCRKFCYIHIDAHTDFLPGYRNPEGTVMYSSFVEDIRKDNAKDLILIGSFISGYKGCASSLIMGCINKPGALDEISAHLDNTYDDVYVSFDLDVLQPGEVITGWENDGRMSRKQLMEFAQMIKEKKRIISGDICGYTASAYNFNTRKTYVDMVRNSRSVYRDIINLFLS